MTETEQPNAAMRQHWSEVAGPKWVRDRERYDGVLQAFVGPLLQAAAPRTGDAVLDAGCGFGTTTLALAALVGPTGRVVGADISDSMLAELERRAAVEKGGGSAPIETLHADLQVAELPGPFDLVVSRFGVMFFDDPASAWRNLHGATRSGGRLAFVCWQEAERNPWSQVAAVAALAVSPAEVPPPGQGDPGPNSLADPASTETLLTGAGWGQVHIEALQPIITLGADLDDALRYARNSPSVAGAIERAGEDAVLTAVRSALEPYVGADGSVRLPGAAWVVTATA